MRNSEIVQNEAKRIEALNEFKIMGSSPEAAFEEIAAMAANFFQSHIAGISFIDQKKQWFKSKLGIKAKELPREKSICLQTLSEQSGLLVIEDLLRVERYRSCTLVEETPDLHFYAGITLKTEENYPIGTLFVMDKKLRKITEQEIAALKTMSHMVMAQLNLRTREEQITLLSSRMESSARFATLGEMASAVAYEINNPLAIILLKASQLKELVEEGSADKAMILEDLGKIERTAEKIAKIIKGLRVFSRTSESGPLETVRVSQLIEDTMELCRERFLTSSIEVEVINIEDTRIQCRPAQILQLMLNLLSNSFDAVIGLPEKWIRIETRIENERIQVKIIDSGHGIPPEQLKKIMQPFVATKPAGGGLGLSIAMGIAIKHGGSLRYDSTSPNTCFIIELPIKKIERGSN